MTQENARRFYVSKTLKLPLTKAPGGRYLNEEAARALFDRHPAFTNEHGCYIFGLRAAKGYKPIYVGKATRQPLGKEALSDGKIRKINEALLKTRKATLVVAFVVPERKPGPCPAKLIEEIEYVLIQYAYTKNHQIENENGIYRCGWFIDGVLNRNQGQPSADAQTFRKLVGIHSNVHVPQAALKKQQKKARPSNRKK